MTRSNEHDLSVRDDDGEVVAMVTISPVGRDDTTARAISDLIESRYRTGDTIEVSDDE